MFYKNTGEAVQVSALWAYVCIKQEPVREAYKTERHTTSALNETFKTLQKMRMRAGTIILCHIGLHKVMQSLFLASYDTHTVF